MNQLVFCPANNWPCGFGNGKNPGGIALFGHIGKMLQGFDKNFRYQILGQIFISQCEKYKAVNFV